MSHSGTLVYCNLQSHYGTLMSMSHSGTIMYCKLRSLAHLVYSLLCKTPDNVRWMTFLKVCVGRAPPVRRMRINAMRINYFWGVVFWRVSILRINYFWGVVFWKVEERKDGPKLLWRSQAWNSGRWTETVDENRNEERTNEKKGMLKPERTMWKGGRKVILQRDKKLGVKQWDCRWNEDGGRDKNERRSFSGKREEDETVGGRYFEKGGWIEKKISIHSYAATHWWYKEKGRWPWSIGKAS